MSACCEPGCSAESLCPVHEALAGHEAEVREGIVDEMLMRCHALGHPNPCPWCDPLIAMARGAN